MPGPSRTLLKLLSTVSLLAAATPAAAQEAAPAPAVIHACYVPLTGTVYRIKETGLRSTCSSTSHIEFQWTDGDGALRPTAAAAGDLLQFDGTQWRPVSAQSVGGVTGYEVVILTVSNTYSGPALTILSSESLSCNFFETCRRYTYVYRAVGDAVSATLSCPAGKKAFGVFVADGVATNVLTSGSVIVGTPRVQRDTPNQTMVLQPGQTASASTLPNQYPGQPSTTPDQFSVKLICANAS